MGRKSRTLTQHPGELNLTAMIDVAFQLLAFFLLAIKPVDVFTNLPANRPSPDPVKDRVSTMLRIMVLPQNPGESGVYVLNDTPLTTTQLDDRIRKYAATDPTQTVLIQCAKKSTHRQLVELLDTCAKHHMANLSVVSSAGI
ncbi:MAG: ExbD/TolR family protein [Kiritimatiellia bacterium]